MISWLSLSNLGGLERSCQAILCTHFAKSVRKVEKSHNKWQKTGLDLVSDAGYGPPLISPSRSITRMAGYAPRGDVRTGAAMRLPGGLSLRRSRSVFQLAAAVGEGRGPLGPDGVLIGMVVIEKPLGDSFLGTRAGRRSTDCEVVGLEKKTVLEDNGFCVGQVDRDGNSGQTAELAQLQARWVGDWWQVPTRRPCDYDGDQPSIAVLQFQLENRRSPHRGRSAERRVRHADRTIADE